MCNIVDIFIADLEKFESLKSNHTFPCNLQNAENDKCQPLLKYRHIPMHSSAGNQMKIFFKVSGDSSEQLF